MKTLSEKLCDLNSQALNTIKRKVIAYNKKQGNKKYFDLPLPLPFDMHYNVQIGSSKTYITSVKIIDNLIWFGTESGSDCFHTFLGTELVFGIADSL